MVIHRSPPLPVAGLTLSASLAFRVHPEPTRKGFAALLAFLAFLSLLASVAPAAAAADSSDLVARIQEHYDGVHSLRADFLQETSSRATSLRTTAHGTLYYLRPRSMRWDYQQPQQQFVISGKGAWLYVPEEKTIYVYQVDKIIRSPVVLNFFSGLSQLRETFQISQLPDEVGPPRRHRLELLPRDDEMKSQVSKVMLWIEPETLRVVRIQTIDPLGNTNEIILSNFQMNVPISPSLFTMQVPKGVKVVRQDASAP
jgi:outer membrane lipoprotein-sorting protein